MTQCDTFGLSPAQAAGEIAIVVGVVNNWQTHFAQSGVTARDIASLAERIDGENLLSQRIGLGPGQVSVPACQAKTAEPIPGSEIAALASP